MQEFGGYLPLELTSKKDRFHDCEMDKAFLNCGRSAIYYALLDSSPSLVYIPHYNCDTVKIPIEMLGIPYIYYYLDNSFKPINVNLQENEYILWVNYFGMADRETIDSIYAGYKNLYIDNTQAFFEEPRPDAYHIYSARKFIGVSDGAYLIKDRFKKPEHWRHLPEIGYSSENMRHLLESIEYGVNMAYHIHLRNEKYIFSKQLSMSILTKKILSSVDYGEIKTKRYANFKYLHDRFKNMNMFGIKYLSDTAIAYPLLLYDDSARNKLVDDKIYVPQWWKHVLDETTPDKIEYVISKYLLPLPIDQRYDLHDMETMCGRIFTLFNICQ